MDVLIQNIIFREALDQARFKDLISKFYLFKADPYWHISGAFQPALNMILWRH